VASSRNNTIRNVSYYGFSTNTSCDCSTSIDTLTSAHDSILGAGYDGFYMYGAKFLQIDTAVVDTAGSYGIYLDYSRRATVRGSVVRRAKVTGIYAYSVDTLSLLQDTLLLDSTGVYATYGVDSATIRGNVVDQNHGTGIYLDYNVHARVDSTAITNSGNGLYLYNVSGARVRWSRFAANNVGLWLYYYAGASSVVNSNFIGNAAAGARNDAYGYSGLKDTLFATNNYWNDAAGPQCHAPTTGFTCPSTTGDSIVTGGVVVFPVLAGSAPTPVPPALRPAYAAASMSQGAPSAIAPPQAPERLHNALRPMTPPDAAPRITTPRGVRPFPPAWHAPSKARAHAGAAAKLHP
jgi:hypothetical protein